MINQIPAELRAAYGAFRRERRPDDALTPHTRGFPALRNTQMGLNAELSRHVCAADGTTAHLVPGDGVLAIIEGGGSGSVLGLFQALDGTGIGTSFRGTGRLQIVGLLPDGVHTVTVVRRNGDEIDVKVPEHLYAAESGLAHARTVAFHAQRSRSLDCSWSSKDEQQRDQHDRGEPPG